MTLDESIELWQKGHEHEIVYACNMDVEVHEIVDRVNPWHTGTPTEEGWYLVAYKKRDCDGSFFLEYGTRVWIEIVEGEGQWNECEEEHPVLAWQRIDEYREDDNG